MWKIQRTICEIKTVQKFHFLDCEHRRPRMLTLIWGLIVSLTQLCHTQVGIKASGCQRALYLSL